jgi:long-chain alkane monooxygenase
MGRPRELRFNAFNMTAPSHNWAGLWSHPRDASIHYNTLDYWVDYARTAERGLLDGIFLADVFGVYDVYGASPDTAIAEAVQLPNAEPTLLVSAMALVTKHLSFGITSNLTFEHPYQFARRFSTLDHLTKGRIGWNIVTGYLDSGARGMGHPSGRAHDDRYDLEAFVDLVVPELQSRGVYKTAYREGTLREKLLPGGGPLLHATHPGASFRDPASLVTPAIRTDAPK